MMGYLLLTLLQLSLLNSRIHGVYQEIEGIPGYLDFEPIKSDSTLPNKTRAKINYDVAYTNSDTHPSFLFIGSRKSIDDAISCVGDDVVSSEGTNGDYKIVEMRANENGAQIKGTFPVVRSDMYTFFFFSCYEIGNVYSIDASERKSVVVGHIDFMNPHGYLPAHIWPYIYFYASMTVIFFIVAAAWIHCCWKHKKNVFSYHHFITVIIALTFLESLINLIAYYRYNETGNNPTVLYIIAKGFLIFRKVSYRVAVLLITIGLGVILSSVPKLTAKLLIAYTSSFVVFHVAYEYYMQENNFQDYFNTTTKVLFFAMLNLDAIFYFWVFFSLNRTLDSLDEEDSFKKGVYYRLSWIAIGIFLWSILFCFMEVNYLRQQKYLKPEGWPIFWFFDVGYWEVLNLFILVPAMRVFSPTTEISKYKQISITNDVENNIDEVKKTILSDKDNSSSSSGSNLSDTEEPKKNDPDGEIKELEEKGVEISLDHTGYEELPTDDNDKVNAQKDNEEKDKK